MIFTLAVQLLTVAIDALSLGFNDPDSRCMTMLCTAIHGYARFWCCAFRSVIEIKPFKVAIDCVSL